VSCPIDNVAFCRPRPDQLAVFSRRERSARTYLFALKRVRSLHGRRRKSLPKRAVSFHFMYDNVIDIIP
jgi:hypothetical protein